MVVVGMFKLKVLCEKVIDERRAPCDTLDGIWDGRNMRMKHCKQGLDEAAT